MKTDFRALQERCWSGAGPGTHGAEQAVKAAGLYRSEGKDYVVKDGDLMLFRFNV